MVQKMSDAHLIIEQSGPLKGTVPLNGAKNAVLVILASLILTEGKSRLSNVPFSEDILHMIRLLKDLGAEISFVPGEQVLEIDTSKINKFKVPHDMMKKMRASILVMGPLLARFGRAEIALPGGCVIGSRPINYHLINFAKMGVTIEMDGDFLYAKTDHLRAEKIILEYPSVGATENIMMAAALTSGVTRIINAALEPEVLDLMEVLKKMGAKIEILPPATIQITGVATLKPIDHSIMYDRLEAGALLLATAMTGGEIFLPDVRAYHLDIFLMKLQEMGHTIEIGEHEIGVRLVATKTPKAVSFKTAPYPGFPTDLQAPMMAAQCLAQGISVVEETVFENRLLHVRELQNMGAQIQVEYNRAIITGVEKLYGSKVIASDIRAASALVMAGLVAQGITIMTGIHHWRRGYEALEQKLQLLGARIELKNADDSSPDVTLFNQTTEAWKQIINN
jgi:UDP-N-acetylglucosamine 1-carboxyvinyltransferase